MKVSSELVDEAEPPLANQSKISKIEQDLEDYLRGDTQSSAKSRRKVGSSRQARKRSRAKTEMDQSQEHSLVPRFDKKSSRAESNRLSLFKRFGGTKRRASKKKAKSRAKVRIAEEVDAPLSSERDHLNPRAIRSRR